MYYIDQINTVDSQILAGTSLAEDPSAAWTAATYAIGDERHVAAIHRVFECVMSGSSTISPELDPNRWLDKRPTNRWAPFDIYTNTAASSTTDDIQYVLASRYVNAIMLRGLAGKSVTVSIKDAPGGSTIYPAKTFSLKQSATSYWDYAFGQRKAKPSLILTNLPIRANAEITISVHATGSIKRAIGMIVRGKLRSVQGGKFGGAQSDAEAIPKSYTYRKSYPDGTQTLMVRGSSKDLSCEIIMDADQADRAVQELESLLSRPVGWIASLSPGFSGLSAFGLATKSPVSYKSNHAICQLYIEGII